MTLHYVNMVDPSDTPSERALIEGLFFAYRAFTTPPDAILARHGLGRAHHRILYFVGRSPEISVSELMEVLGVTKQALHSPLATLVAHNWLETGARRGDRRVKTLKLTPAGQGLEAELTGVQVRFLRERLAEADARQTLAALLARLQADPSA